MPHNVITGAELLESLGLDPDNAFARKMELRLSEGAWQLWVEDGDGTWSKVSVRGEYNFEMEVVK